MSSLVSGWLTKFFYDDSDLNDPITLNLNDREREFKFKNSNQR